MFLETMPSHAREATLSRNMGDQDRQGRPGARPSPINPEPYAVFDQFRPREACVGGRDQHTQRSGNDSDHARPAPIIRAGESGLRVASKAQAEQVRAVAVDRVGRQFGSLEAEAMKQLGL
jgi:hypothetical protein